MVANFQGFGINMDVNFQKFGINMGVHLQKSGIKKSIKVASRVECPYSKLGRYCPLSPSKKLTQSV